MRPASSAARAIAAAILCSACATGAASPDTGSVSDHVVLTDASGNVYRSTKDTRGRDISVMGSVAQVQAALADTYKELDLELNTIDPANGIFGATNVVKTHSLGGVAISNYLNCGDSFSGPRANTDRIRLTLLTTVKPDGNGGARVATNLQATAQDAAGGNSRDLATCSSTGSLEGRVNTSIASKLVK